MIAAAIATPRRSYPAVTAGKSDVLKGKMLLVGQNVLDTKGGRAPVDPMQRLRTELPIPRTGKRHTTKGT